jgi:outer membrane protein assembly factor BamB
MKTTHFTNVAFWLSIAAVLLSVNQILIAANESAQSTPASYDWPQWRGPHRDAISQETGLLKSWPATGPKLAWEINGLGTGYSSLAIVGNTLFTMGDLKEDGQNAQYILAFDLASKQRLWKAKVGPPHGDGSRCTPTVDGPRIYALGTDGDLVCVDTAKGQEIWRKSLPKDFGGKMMSGWKYSESPLIDGEKLLCTPGGQTVMVALDKKSGNVIWKCQPADTKTTGGAGYSSIVVSEGAGVRQYVTVMGRGAVGVAAAEGQLLWTYPRVANDTANIPTPVVKGDFVFVSTAYGAGAALLKLVKDSTGVKADEVYFLKADTFQSHHGGFLCVGDYIFGAHGHNQGNPICLELATGKVLWREKQLGKGSGSVLYADGQLYYRYEDDTLALIEANPSRYVLKGSFKMPERPGAGGPGWAHPVIHNGHLYVRHNDVLFCYDIKGK